MNRVAGRTNLSQALDAIDQSGIQDNVGAISRATFGLHRAIFIHI